LAERPRLSDAPERRIYRSDELSQVLTASTEPWRTFFLLAAVVGGRVSERLGLRWFDRDLGDLDHATVRFTHQVDRQGRRVELKTEEARPPCPFRAASPQCLGPRRGAVRALTRQRFPARPG
jgi:integrase